MLLSRYVKTFPNPDQPGTALLFSCRTGAVVKVSDATLTAAREGTLSPQSAATLEKLRFLADPDKEREELRTWFERLNSRRQRFGAIVVLTRACNLACPYCFEARQPGLRDMDEATADRIVAMIKREYLAKGWKAEIDFYGGEALLRPDLLRRIAAPLREAAQANGTTFSCNLVSNGTLLTRAVAEELAGYGLRSAKVTLDGPPEIHDRCRSYTSGNGSFAAILRAVGETADIIPIVIGGNYTEDSWREFPRLLDILLAEGLTPDRVRMIRFDPVIGTGSGKGLPDFPEGCSSMDEPWLREAFLTLREEILKRGFTTSRPGPLACLIESDHDLIIDTDGTFYKCPAFLGRPEYAAGNMDSGAAADVSAYNRDNWKNEECLDCSYLPLCFGGCLKLVESGGIDGVACQKAFYDASLERMVRQDVSLRCKGQSDLQTASANQ